MVFVNHMIAYVHFLHNKHSLLILGKSQDSEVFLAASCILHHKTRVLTFTEVFGHEDPISFADIIIEHFSFTQVNSSELKNLKTVGVMLDQHCWLLKICDKKHDGAHFLRFWCGIRRFWWPIRNVGDGNCILVTFNSGWCQFKNEISSMTINVGFGERFRIVILGIFSVNFYLFWYFITQHLFESLYLRYEDMMLCFYNSSMLVTL